MWIQVFNSECDRLKVTTELQPQALRLVLEGSPLEWYMGEWKLKRESTWEEWITRFLEAFTEQGWKDMAYAVSYKYFRGSYSEFIIKKNSLLIDAVPDMCEKVRVGLCVIMLPSSIREKIDPKNVDTQGKLLSEVNKWDSFLGKTHKNSNVPGQSEEKGKFESRGGTGMIGRREKKDYEDCLFCSKRGYKGRKHPEKYCWNNPDSPDYRKPMERRKEPGGSKEKCMKIANNVEMRSESEDEEFVKN